MSGRVYGLDNWRAILLLAGPLVHGSFHVGLRFEDSRLFVANVSQLSHAFRMETFFAIAGFLGAHASLKNGTRLIKRLTQLGLPMLVVWLTIMYPLYRIIDPPVRFEAQHLWFIVTMMITEAVFYLLPLDTLKDVSERHTILAFGAWIISVIFFRVLGTTVAFLLSGPNTLNWLIGILSLVPFYALFYLFGYIAAGNAMVTNTIKSGYLLISAICVLFVHMMFFNILLDDIQRSHGVLKGVWLMSGAATASLLCPAILGRAISTTKRSAVLHRLSRSAFTVYLLHYPIIGLVAYALAGFNLSATVELIVLVGAGFTTSVIIHEQIIMRSKVLGLLFNGRLALPSRLKA